MAPGNFAKAKAAEVPHEPTNLKEAMQRYNLSTTTIFDEVSQRWEAAKK